MGSYKIQVPVIVNSNTAQVLVVTEIPLSPPAFKIDEIHKVIEIDDCAAVCDKVIINGRLIKSISTMVDGYRSHNADECAQTKWVAAPTRGRTAADRPVPLRRIPRALSTAG